MKIVIAGAGKVGFNLAKTLSIGHDVTIIDTNRDALERIVESLDILPLEGDVEDAKTYESFADKRVDLFIAVTNLDNVNLIATLVADTVLDIQKKFVRLQKEFFDTDKVKEKLGIDKLIFPTHLASESIGALLHYPKANNVKVFKYTEHKLISVMVSSRFVPRSFTMKHTKIVGIERKKEFFIPKKDENIEILPNDLVYFFGAVDEIVPLCRELELDSSDAIRRCVVFGGDDLGVRIAKELLTHNREVKLVEKDLDLCEKADEILEGKAAIINSKYSSHELFEEEYLSNADMFVAATNNDEYNIIKSLEAKESGIKKVVAINNEMEYYNLMHSLGIVVVRGPKMSAYNSIMEEISSNGVVIQKSYCGAKATLFMRRIFADSKVLRKKIKPLKAANILCLIVREQEIFVLEEKVLLEENDLIVLFATSKESTKAKQWIYGL